MSDIYLSMNKGGPENRQGNKKCPAVGALLSQTVLLSSFRLGASRQFSSLLALFTANSSLF